MQGVAALSVNWGAWAGSGMAERAGLQRMMRQGYGALQPAAGLCSVCDSHPESTSTLTRAYLSQALQTYAQYACSLGQLRNEGVHLTCRGRESVSTWLLQVLLQWLRCWRDWGQVPSAPSSCPAFSYGTGNSASFACPCTNSCQTQHRHSSLLESPQV